METEILQGNSPKALKRAVAYLAEGTPIAFPTETVYGLGADAKNPAAISRIFSIKGRPANNPLIVHCLDQAMAQSCVLGWDERCESLARQFWPGPLTLILNRHSSDPPTVAGGGETLAVRVPAHIVARALLAHFEAPIAAPSANLSTRVSPTSAKHVLKTLEGKIPLILDGGPCQVGLETTVLDMTSDQPTILRLGDVSEEMISQCLGLTVQTRSFDEQAPKSPGMMRRHYAPKTPIRFCRRPDELPKADFALLYFEPNWDAKKGINPSLRLPDDPKGYGRELYRALHWADEQNQSEIIIQETPDNKGWAAVRDRLSRSVSDPTEQ
ncbi:MAG: L-threonylcarbamoyladenylate synthase [Myxococcota bacterium]|nr:L-threonylcarbamoyladenylate synthase [Myxococcota bacterium]